MTIEVVGAVIMQDNQILAARRPFEKTLGGLWEFPGGKIEVGESAQEALVREIKEELLCAIDVKDYIVNEVYTYDFATVSLSTYFCALKEGYPMKTEHIELRWLDIEDIDSVKWAPADYPTLNILKNKLKV
ncbi:MAG: (deoxy)nucleoside triphosphate pyrophosphohydrolase [Atopostipes suicloacalis]|nr:(deoxy)nucleoside triphosphate pyrophosphohydrolase [Atopostipes suicloacalis]